MKAPTDSEPAISIGQLRQNPTEMIRHVRDGDEYVLTDRGAPIAKIVPYRVPQWVDADTAREAFRTPFGAQWSKDLEATRRESDMQDPFAR